MAAAIRIQDIYNEIAKIDPKQTIGSESFKACVVLLSALSVGQNEKELSAFTGLPPFTIKKFAKNLRANGIWQHGKTRSDWFDKKTGIVNFFLDVNVALGWIKRE